MKTDNKAPRLLLKCLLLAAALLQVSCSALSSRILSDPVPAAERLRSGGTIENEISQLAKPLVENGELDSIVVATVLPDGSSKSEGYARQGEPVPDGNDIFQVGSISKVFLAAVLAVLVDEGTLKYEDTLGEIMPPEVKLSRAARTITLHQLVTHTSGLPRQSTSPKAFAYFVRYLFTGKNLFDYIDSDYLYNYMRHCRISERRIGKYRYSNIGTAILTLVLEIKTGKTYPDLAREKVFGPLKMDSTGFFLTKEQRSRLVPGHAGHQPLFMRRHTVIAPWDMGEVMNPVGGLYSTANDLLLFARANIGMSGGVLEDPLALTYPVQLHTPEQDITRCWVINYFDEGRTALYYRHGMTSGYSAYMGFNKEKRIAVVALTGTFVWEDKVGHNLLLRLSEGTD